MTEPLCTDEHPAAADLSERERDARVEELLLSGLDHYFSGHHELAINVWTRVLFLDRGHARARAYIERARGAVAERQREGEELVQTGIAAFQRGEAGAARELLSSALDRGARTDEALSLLQRLDRLEAAAVMAERHDTHRRATRDVDPAVMRVKRSRVAWIATGVVCGLVTGAVGLTLWWTRGAEWLPIGPAAAPAGIVQPVEPLPVPAASDVWIARARTFHDKGRLREALAALDAIRPDDPVYAQAEDLRATIQRQLLAASRPSAPSAPSTPEQRQ
jgi:hypothetical protein